MWLLVFEKEVTLKYLRIFFEAEPFDKITKDSSAKFSDVLAAIGGTMGLLTGFSIISGIEILYFGIKIILNSVKIHIKRKKGQWSSRGMRKLHLYFDIFNEIYCQVSLKLIPYFIDNSFPLYIPLTGAPKSATKTTTFGRQAKRALLNVPLSLERSQRSFPLYIPLTGIPVRSKVRPKQPLLRGERQAKQSLWKWSLWLYLNLV